ncbi:MAG TPA: response regulator [bacterium]|nr:response regulator [bacterium]HPN43947.1 response regulator [bacterium]
MNEKINILYLDDDVRWGASLKELLPDYNIIFVLTESDFLKKLEEKEFKPAIFIIDWILSDPDITAQEIISTLVKNYLKIPRIILTHGKGKEGTNLFLSKTNCIIICKDDENYLSELTSTINAVTSAVNENEANKEIDSIETFSKNVTSTEKFVKIKERELNLLTEIIKYVVDEKLSIEKFIKKLLYFLMQYFNCQGALVIKFDSNEGFIAFNENLEGITQINFHKIEPFEIIKKDSLEKMAFDLGTIDNKTILLEIDDKFFIKNCIVNSFNKKKCLVKLLIDELNLQSCIILFSNEYKNIFDNTDITKLEELPLDTILHCAYDIPFRVSEQHGLGYFFYLNMIKFLNLIIFFLKIFISSLIE